MVVGRRKAVCCTASYPKHIVRAHSGREEGAIIADRSRRIAHYAHSAGRCRRLGHILSTRQDARQKCTELFFAIRTVSSVGVGHALRTALELPGHVSNDGQQSPGLELATGNARLTAVSVIRRADRRAEEGGRGGGESVGRR